MYESPKSKHTLFWWFGMGSLPGIGYVLDMILINVTGSSFVGVPMVMYAVLTPLLALFWLLTLAREEPIIHFADGGPSMTRGSYVIRLLGAHIAVWVLLSLMAITETTAHFH